MEGDGTELCCMVNPIRRHKGCTLSFCKDHWWDPNRRKANLVILPEWLWPNRAKEIDSERDICPRCSQPFETRGFDDWERIGDDRDRP